MRLFVLLFVACANSLQAQYDDLLRKDRYTWVAEYTTDYELNPVYSDNVTTERNLVHTIRLESVNRKNSLFQDLELKHYLSHAMLQGLASGAFACFADEQLTQPLSTETVLRRLSIPGARAGFDHPYDTATVLNEVRPDEIDLFRIRLVMFFDGRKKQFGSRLLAVAPMLYKTDDVGENPGERQPLLWIKIAQNTARDTKKTAKTATYAVQTYMRENAPATEEMKTLKGSLDPKKWAAGEVRKPTHPCLAYDDYSVLDATALQARIFSVDTIIVVDPETFEESAAIVRDNAIDRVEKIRLVQNWYYDERKHRLAMQIVAVAPLAAVRDSEGELRYYKPLFYSKY